MADETGQAKATGPSKPAAKSAARPAATRRAAKPAAKNAAKPAAGAAKAAEESAAKTAEVTAKSGEKAGATAGEKAATYGAGMKHAVSVPLATVRAGALSAGKTALSRTGVNKVAAAAAWSVIKAKRTAVAGAGAGVLAAGAGTYLLGRRSATRRFGPLTRATGGRL